MDYDQISRERNDAEMMKHPQHWPCKYFLPVKHRSRQRVASFPLCGVLVREKGPVVYLVNMYDLEKTPINDETPQEKFETFEEVVADGWVVD